MRTLSAVSAIPYSTFRFDAVITSLTELETLDDLQQYCPDTMPIVLGDGSNTIFLQDQLAPVCRFTAKNKTPFTLDDRYTLIHVEAGHNWHELVSWSVVEGFWGIENLALIPGTVGAAPVQNIGAYGVEFADVCLYVDFFHWQTKKLQRFTASQCLFGYRDSIFKNQLAGKGIIVAAGILLQKAANPVLNYKGLDQLPESCSSEAVYKQVIAIRKEKLPDPLVLANCGSFFKNPVLTRKHYQQLQQQFPGIPGFEISATEIKVPAAWFIDQQGFKGYRYEGVGCHIQQPLVLVNYGNGTAEQLLILKNQIEQKVLTAYGVQLEAEVRMLGA